MRGDDRQQEAIFSYISPEQRVPLDHPLRAIRQMLDRVGWMFTFTVAAYNLVRIRNLVGAPPRDEGGKCVLGPVAEARTPLRPSLPTCRVPQHPVHLGDNSHRQNKKSALNSVFPQPVREISGVNWNRFRFSCQDLF